MRTLPSFRFWPTAGFAPEKLLRRVIALCPMHLGFLRSPFEQQFFNSKTPGARQTQGGALIYTRAVAMVRCCGDKYLGTSELFIREINDLPVTEGPSVT